MIRSTLWSGDSIKILTRWKDILWWMILGVLFLHLGLHVLAYRWKFLEPYDRDRLGRNYSYSPYVRGSGTKVGIGDDGLYAFAGYYYLFDAGDVSRVNFEHPPLGKYLIGLSIAATGNENAINIVYFTVLLWVTYRLALALYLPPPAALFSVLFVSFNSLLLNHVHLSMLDLPFTVFFLIGIYFFLLGKKRPSRYVLAHLFQALAFSTRFYPFLVVVLLIETIYVWMYDRKHIRRFFLSSLLIPAVYFCAHISYFYYHPSFIEFMRHKKWMLAWFTGSPRIPGNIWRTIFTGWYADSTGAVVYNTLWSPVVLTVVMLAALCLILRPPAYSQHRYMYIFFIVISYLVYITFLTNGSEKFLLPVYPILCILSVRQIVSMGKWAGKKISKNQWSFYFWKQTQKAGKRKV